VPPRVATVVNVPTVRTATKVLKASSQVPDDELLQNIEDWKLVWPDATSAEKNRNEKVAAEIGQRQVKVATSQSA